MSIVPEQNNLCRGLLGALGTSVINPLTKAIGSGYTFVRSPLPDLSYGSTKGLRSPIQLIFVGVCVLFSPIMMLEWRYGMSWRLERGERERAEKERAVGEAGGGRSRLT